MGRGAARRHAQRSLDSVALASRMEAERGHLDASVAQRMLATLPPGRQVASFPDVQLVALLTQDPALADEFVADSLGELATADPALLYLVLTYIREQCNASRAATRLFTHRNTVLRRLARADDLLPRPVAENVVNVAAALELLRWRWGGYGPDLSEVNRDLLVPRTRP